MPVTKCPCNISVTSYTNFHTFERRLPPPSRHAGLEQSGLGIFDVVGAEERVLADCNHLEGEREGWWDLENGRMKRNGKCKNHLPRGKSKMVNGFYPGVKRKNPVVNGYSRNQKLPLLLARVLGGADGVFTIFAFTLPF